MHFFFYSGWDYWGVPTKLWRPRWRHTFETAARTVHPSRLIRSSWNATTTHNTQHTKFKKKTAAEKRPNTTHPTNTTRNEKRRIKNKKNKNKDNLHRRRRRDLDDLRDLSRRPQSIFFCFVLLSLPARRWSEGGVEWSDATQSSPLRMFRLTFFDLCNVWRSIISFHFTWNEVATRFAIGGPASSSSSSAGHWCRPAPLFFFFWFWSIRQWRWWTWSRSIRFDYIRRPGPPYWATYWTHTHNPVRLLFLVAFSWPTPKENIVEFRLFRFRQRDRERERKRERGRPDTVVHLPPRPKRLSNLIVPRRRAKTPKKKRPTAANKKKSSSSSSSS